MTLLMGIVLLIFAVDRLTVLFSGDAYQVNSFMDLNGPDKKQSSTALGFVFAFGLSSFPLMETGAIDSEFGSLKAYQVSWDQDGTVETEIEQR